MISSFIWVAIGGAIIGALLNELWHIRTKTYGIIEVDHSDNSCKVHVTREELVDRKHKIAVFKIDHNADFSRDEQSL